MYGESVVPVFSPLVGKVPLMQIIQVMVVAGLDKATGNGDAPPAGSVWSANNGEGWPRPSRTKPAAKMRKKNLFMMGISLNAYDIP